jgi:hypothetical protein
LEERKYAIFVAVLTTEPKDVPVDLEENPKIVERNSFRDIADDNNRGFDGLLTVELVSVMLLSMVVMVVLSMVVELWAYWRTTRAASPASSSTCKGMGAGGEPWLLVLELLHARLGKRCSIMMVLSVVMVLMRLVVYRVVVVVLEAVVPGKPVDRV